MRDDLRKLYALLTPRERKLGATVVAVMVAAAGLQALTAGSLYPFLSAVSDPSTVESGRPGWIYDTLGFTGERQFFVFAGLAVLALVVRRGLHRPPPGGLPEGEGLYGPGRGPDGARVRAHRGGDEFLTVDLRDRDACDEAVALEGGVNR